MPDSNHLTAEQERRPRPDVSLVIPVFNEEENLPPLWAEIENSLSRQSRIWEVVFIDDGSTDKSLDILRDLARRHHNARYLSLEENMGQSAAFAAGFQAAKGRSIVTLDADLQNDPADIPAMLDIFDQGYDVVAGYRQKRRDTLAKRLASKIANSIRNALTGESVRDTGCSLKILNAEMARKLPMFKGMHRFLPTLMKFHQAKVTEIPVNHRYRMHGKSKYGIWDRAFSAFFDLLAVRWMQRRWRPYRIKEKI